MDRVEAFGLFAGHLDALRGDDAQAGLLQHLGDGAGQVATGRVGLMIEKVRFAAMMVTQLLEIGLAGSGAALVGARALCNALCSTWRSAL